MPVKPSTPLETGDTTKAITPVIQARIDWINSQIDRCMVVEAYIEQQLQTRFGPYMYEQAEPWHIADPLDAALLNLQIRLDNFAIKMEAASAAVIALD